MLLMVIMLVIMGIRTMRKNDDSNDNCEDDNRIDDTHNNVDDND